MNIYVVGSGKLANSILSPEFNFDSCKVVKWQPEMASSNEKSILVHAGSGRELDQCFQFCRNTGSILIELSTGLKTETMDADFPLIVCPNTSILILRVMHMLRTMGKTFKGNNVAILESHQSTKTSAPGTAYKLAEYLHVPIEKIQSIRDPEIQKKLGIEKAYLDKHAFHRITISEGNDEVTIETKVRGHDSYATGVKRIIEVVLTKPLQHKRYKVLDLIEGGWL